MTLEEASEAMKKYESIVMGQEIGDVGHKIQGFGIDMISPGNYEVYVIGQNLSSYTNFISKPLSEWVSQNL